MVCKKDGTGFQKKHFEESCRIKLSTINQCNDQGHDFRLQCDKFNCLIRRNDDDVEGVSKTFTIQRSHNQISKTNHLRVAEQ